METVTLELKEKLEDTIKARVKEHKEKYYRKNLAKNILNSNIESFNNHMLMSSTIRLVIYKMRKWTWKRKWRIFFGRTGSIFSQWKILQQYKSSVPRSATYGCQHTWN